ncbi:response regulator transcription factor [Corynebacterium pseudokroppenstedtii]|uniref:Response regulator transcription factor n=1 Tax=Corynebacterium pseudokroppenstedtii TaxID=2804917 RepID=A0AAU0Q1I6_9CORY|nr:response regulator transcription factor [Corynebacterium pseudokroppenstedtii]MDU6478603.1 response regulator transcription factor [Corynebacterium kroppenstedtii]MBY0790709.1 response regulator transcription factor [Corynebacterium pseudokroppenstedtii]MCF6792523.1 response regulator transcription factor [Corynebacterium pseudokroppenstedtii]MCF8702461.1 response regulator transcription factor [Corynebacterium pseudokroppenstedtii]MCG2635979.1 response regulator transcription factor [Coryn
MKIVIADDSALLREGVAGLVEKRGYEVIAKPTSATELLDAVTSLGNDHGLPDLLITDVRMPPDMREDGLRAALQLRERFPSLSIMVLSQYVAPAYARELFAPGTSHGAGTGYLLKDRIGKVKDFLESITIVAQGGVVIDPDVATALMKSGRSGLRLLTAREREVMELMARGKSNAEIAQDLFLSGAAVAKHVSNIFLKLNLEPGEDNRRVRAILEYLTETTGLI